MIDRIILKLRELIHYVLHLNVYYKKKVILRGVPKILHCEKLKLSKNVRINENVFLHAANGIVIGQNTTLSYGATLITESYVTDDYSQYCERHHNGSSIIIGDNVWICANATILSGVTIANNIIVGAGAVVTHDLLEENAVYAGNPARLIKRMENWKR